MAAPYRNWATAVREIRDLYRRASNSEDAIKRALCEAVERMDHEELWFKEGRFGMVLTAGTHRYGRGDGAGTSASIAYEGLPLDLEGFAEEFLELWPQGSESAKIKLRSASRREAEVDGLEFADSLQTGSPSGWTWANEELIFNSVPSISTDVVTGLYIRSLGVPYSIYSGSAWGFYKPDESPMTDTYPDPGIGEANGWFKEGYHMLKWKASFLLNYHHFHDEAEANAAIGQFEEAKRNLTAQGHRQRGGYVRPSFSTRY